MGNIDIGKGYAYGGGSNNGKSLPLSQFCYECKTTLKN